MKELSKEDRFIIDNINDLSSSAGNVLFAKLEENNGKEQSIMLQSGFTKSKEAKTLAENFHNIYSQQESTVLTGLDIVSTYFYKNKKKNVSDLQNLLYDLASTPEEDIWIIRPPYQKLMTDFISALEDYCRTAQELVGSKKLKDKVIYVCTKAGYDASVLLLARVKRLNKDNQKLALRILMLCMDLPQINEEKIKAHIEALKKIGIGLEDDKLSSALQWLRRAFHTEVQLAVYEKKN